MSEKVPTVSVIIPTYNRAYLVGRSIQSVLNQTYQDFELIVVDDASTDGTEDVVRSFNDKRIRYLKHDKNKGGAAARNTGIIAARGEYIAFQDSDDEWVPEKLEKQMKAMKTVSPVVGVVYTGFYRLQGDKKTYIPSSKVIKKEGDILSSLIKKNFVTTQAMVVKRECLEKAGLFDEDLPRFQDWELCIRISKHYHFKLIDEPLVILYHQPVSISTNQKALIEARKLILHKHFDIIKKDRKTLANHYLKIAHLLFSAGTISDGRSYYVRAFQTYPLNLKAVCAVLISLLGESFCQIMVSVYKGMKKRIYKLGVDGL